jgi:alpha-1,2-mannosyltransferase
MSLPVAHWLDRRRLLLYTAAIFAVYVALGLLFLSRFPHGVDAQGHSVRPDFVVFWAASRLALSGHAADAYNPALIGAVEHQALPQMQAMGEWVYPPTFLLLALPLALLPFFWSYLVFMAATLCGYAVVLCRTVGSGAALMPALAFPAVCFNLVEGQNGFLTSALLGGALLLLERSPAWAGLLIALLGIKPQLGLLLPLVLIAAGHWRAFVCAAACSLLFLALGIGVLGYGTLAGFLGSLDGFAAWAASDRGLLLTMPTFFALFRLLGLPTGVALLLHGLVAAAVATAVVWLWRRRGEAALRHAALAAGTLLISPYLLDYDLALLGLAIAWFAVHALRRGWRRGEREMLVLAWLLPLFTIAARQLQFQFTPILLLALFLMILRRGFELKPGSDADQSTVL